VSTFDPQKLLDAKRKKAEERRLEEEEQQRQREEENTRLLSWQAERQQAAEREAELHERHSQLSNYVSGIYDEISKLSIKWPTQPASNLTVTKANRAINTMRELVADDNDEYIDELQPFEPAGDNPEARDVTMMLRQVKDALSRMSQRHRSHWKNFY